VHDDETPHTDAILKDQRYHIIISKTPALKKIVFNPLWNDKELGIFLVLGEKIPF
jgi:hypothetical protein